MKDGYIEFHTSMGSAAGKYTNNFMAWLYHEGAIEENTAKMDWTLVPELLRSKQLAWDKIDKIYDIAQNFFLKYTKLEVMEAAKKWKILMAPIYSVKDLAESEQLEAREFPGGYYWE